MKVPKMKILKRCTICDKILWPWKRKGIFGKHHKWCDQQRFFDHSMGIIPNLGEQWKEREKYLY